MKNIEKMIEEVNGTMNIEGMPLTAEDKERIRKCLVGEKCFDTEIKELVKKYTIKDDKNE